MIVDIITFLKLRVEMYSNILKLKDLLVASIVNIIYIYGGFLNSSNPFQPTDLMLF